MDSVLKGLLNLLSKLISLNTEIEFKRCWGSVATFMTVISSSYDSFYKWELIMTIRKAVMGISHGSILKTRILRKRKHSCLNFDQYLRTWVKWLALNLEWLCPTSALSELKRFQ